MSLIEVNRNPSPKELRNFGLLFLLFAGLVGASFLWRTHSFAIARGIWIGGAALMAVFFAIPPLRKPIYLGWIYATFPIGYVVSHVVLAVVYYGVFTPIGLVMRMVGRDPMTRRFDRAATTYWVEHDPSKDPKRYFRQS